MRCFSFFVRIALLFTIPSLALCPQGGVPSVTVLSQTPPFTYDTILNFINALETEDLSTYSSEELDRINHFLAHLARQGLVPGEVEEESILESDIQELLEEEDNAYEYAYSAARDYVVVPALAPHEVLPCKNWVGRKCHQTKKFVKKHKKAIIIGTAVAVVVVVTALVVPALIAGAAGAAAAAGEGEKKIPEAPSTPVISAEDPAIQETVTEQIATFKESIGEQETTTISFQDKIRDLGSRCCHSTLDAVSTLLCLVPQGLQEVQDTCHRIITPSQGFFSFEDASEMTPMQNYQEMVAFCHEQIDTLFATDQAQYHTLEFQAARDRELITGILPPPGTSPKIAKMREFIKADTNAAVVAEELGFTAREITYLAEAGTLESTVANTFETVVNDHALVKSIALHKNAQEFLKPYAKKPLPENKVREYIHEAGIPTFPKPQGIPEDFMITVSDKGAGMKYLHPKNTHTYVRVMPGKPHSPFPYQQKPYVNQRINGKSLDKHGNVVLNDSPESHIPLEEFIYRGKIEAY